MLNSEVMGLTDGSKYYRRTPRQRKSKRSDNFKKNFRRRKRTLRRFFGNRFFILICSIVFIFGLGYLIFFSSIFEVSEVRVRLLSGEQELDAAALTQEARKSVLGRNLLFLSSRNLFFLTQDVTVKRIELNKIWPNTLELEVVRRAGNAILQDGKGNEFLVDEEGVVFAPAGKVNLPMIKYPSKTLFVGDKVQGRKIEFVLAVLYSCARENLEVSSVHAGGNLTVEFVNGPQVLLAFEERSIEQMIDMVLQFRDQGEQVSRIDLRFKNPVVEYSE